jgi:class 3 adenylate cyclase
MATRTVATNDDATRTVAQLLELHPWPKEHASAKRIEKLWVFEVPGTPETIWPYIADTSRMNRALGTAVMTFAEVNGKRCGVSKPGGVRHEWIEEPWNWVANQWLTCVRVYERGFMKLMYAIHRVEPCAAGTRIYLYFGAVPRGAFGSAALRLGFPTLEKAYRRVLPALAKQLHESRPAVLMLPAPQLTDEARTRLKAQRDLLVGPVGLDAACVDALFEWIATGDDPDLHRIQIRERARVWKLDEQEMLRVALHATRGGVLSLSWDTVCPHCRGVRDENARLSNLAAESHCDACQVTFGTDTQEAVEVTFRVHSSIRDVPDQVYCSAEPSKKDHIRVQRTLAPGQTAVLEPKLAPGRYTVWGGHRGGWYLDVDAEGPETVTWKEHPEGTVIAGGTGARIELTNDGNEIEQFTIEEARWKDHALRAAHLLSFQEFRDLFSEDYIGADVRLGVGEQTVLFTDVVGSTAFYAAKGDPAAFVEIKKHFDEVFAIVGTCRGAVIKTIGDAVMATFTNPIDAVRASHQIHKTFHPTRADTPIRLRISLNTGPCIAVRLNSNADFFGGTVNIAAKLQALAEGYQIAMSETTYNAPGVAAFMAEHAGVAEPMTYTSKALPAPVQVRRWTVFRE